MNGSFKVSGNLVDIQNKKIFPATVEIGDGKIASVTPATGDVPSVFILPGFVDAHVHIESSMLIPSEFARLAVVHGTVSTVSDPHEIANVCGMAGVDFMINNGKKVPFATARAHSWLIWPATRLSGCLSSLQNMILSG